MKVNISQKELEILRAILDGPYDVLLFGSRVNRKNAEFSDLDIALRAKNTILTPKLVMIKVAFSESNLPYKIDLLDYNDVSTAFQKKIDEQCVNLNEAEPGA